MAPSGTHSKAGVEAAADPEAAAVGTANKGEGYDETGPLRVR